MDINKSFTYEDLEKAMNKLKPKKEVHVNQQTYNEIVEILDSEPLNLKVNNYIPVNQAVILDTEEMKKNMLKVFGVPKEYLNQ